MKKKMIRSIVIFGVALVLGITAGFASAADAGSGRAGNDFGLGFVLGNPSGLSAKIPSGPSNSINLILGYDANGRWNDNNANCCGDGRLYLGGDYVWYNYNLIHVAQGRLPFYYGPGAWASIANNSSFGLRIALGLEYQFANAPFDIFLEIGPGIRIMPNTNGVVSAGLGGRFFF